MDDKWFIYYEEDENKLYMHRSWTGYCVWIVKFEDKEDHFEAISAVANRDPAQYSGDDDTDVHDLLDIINMFF
jgi:hypothetical protein